jgi:pimeloyl-ACP methyl ester carboxylesterase
VKAAGYYPLLEELPEVVLGDKGTGSLVEQAAEIAALLGGRPHLVVGHSLGGPVAVQLALDRPELVSGLVLLDMTPFNEPTSVKRLLPATRVIAACSRVAPKALATLVRSRVAKDVRGRDVSPEAVARASAWVDDPEEYRRLTAILRHFPEEAARLTTRLRTNPQSFPGVVVSADHKSTKVVAAHREVAELLGLRHETWAGTSHSLHVQEPARVRALVLEHLGAVAR